MMVRLGAAVLLVAVVGCAEPANVTATSPSAGPAPAPAPAAPPPFVWTTTLDRQHPLVGRIWSVRANAFVDEAQVLAALHGNVLLGEKHDNPDHHALQARMLRVMIGQQRRPIVAFEMFDVDQQGAIDASRAEHPRDAAALATAVHWDRSGWPPWNDNYAPIAQLALDAGLTIVATGLPRERMRALMQPAGGDAGGGGQLPIDEGTPLTPEQEASLREELKESHCGHLPEKSIGAMIRFQRARDASMESAMLAAANAAHAADTVLIAGTGHTRTDRGAGHDLAVRDTTRKVTSIAFTEVSSDQTVPTAYASRWNVTSLPFDFVWFTPRANDDDPCAGFGE